MRRPDEPKGTAEVDRRIDQAHEDELRFLRRCHERAREAMRRVARKPDDLTGAKYGVGGRGAR
jgi:hypothetical protein